MSLECSECERDLRGGHDPACSRYVPEVGEVWIDNDKRLDGRRVVIEWVTPERVGYKTIGGKTSVSSSRKRFAKAFQLSSTDSKASPDSKEEGKGGN